MHAKVHTEGKGHCQRQSRRVGRARGAYANWECVEGACQLHLLNDISYQRNCRETDLEQIALTPPYLAYGKPYTHTNTHTYSYTFCEREQKKCEG